LAVKEFIPTLVAVFAFGGGGGEFPDVEKLYSSP
jgi:hypothetical protein